MKKILVGLLMLLVMIVVTACGGGGSSSNIFTDAGAMEKIMGQLQEKPEFKGKKLMVFQDVTVVNSKDHGGNFIVIDILKPGTEDVDRYEYRNGSWSDGAPVKITGDGNMADNVIPMADLHFEKLPEIYKTFSEKVKDKKDVKVEQTAVYRFWNGEWSVLIDAESEREEYGAEFKPDGTLISLKKK